jgi:hypothetical protein
VSRCRAEFDTLHTPAARAGTRVGVAGRVRRAAALAALAAPALGVLLSLPGCAANPSEGYAFASSYRTDIASVSVPIFGNDTYSRGIEVQLTEAVIAEIRRATPWKIIQGSAAQTTLSGTIVSSEMAKLSTARDTGLVEELAVVLSVNFTWKDNRTGKTLVTRTSFRAAEPFVPARGTSGPINERLDVGQAGSVQEMARRIVAELRASW